MSRKVTLRALRKAVKTAGLADAPLMLALKTLADMPEARGFLLTMRSLKPLFLAPAGHPGRGCNSEWPYEVTETHKQPAEASYALQVAIANGRMRSLKRSSSAR